MIIWSYAFPYSRDDQRIMAEFDDGFAFIDIDANKSAEYEAAKSENPQEYYGNIGKAL